MGHPAIGPGGGISDFAPEVLGGSAYVCRSDADFIIDRERKAVAADGRGRKMASDAVMAVQQTDHRIRAEGSSWAFS